MKSNVSTPAPESTSDQAKAAADSSPTTTEAPAKAKKPTPTEIRKELEDLKPVAAARMMRIRTLEVQAQRCRDLLKDDGRPGMTMNEDHHRLAEIVKGLRKILNVTPGEVTILGNGQQA